jgi:hypothetical protein
MTRDGRSFLPISREAGIGYRTLRGPVEDEHVAMAERTARRLAEVWDDVPDESRRCWPAPIRS